MLGLQVCYAAAIASKGRKGMSFESAHAHFVKVCQAIFQEASDLSVFLDKVEAAQQVGPIPLFSCSQINFVAFIWKLLVFQEIKMSDY